MKFNTKLVNYILLAVAAILMVASMLFPSRLGDLNVEAGRIEKCIGLRLKSLDRCIDRALESEDPEFLFFAKDIPDDFVLYRYEGTSLKSWRGQFPVQNDEYIGKGSRNSFSKVTDSYTFSSFSGESYLLRSAQKGSVEVIAGLSLNGNRHLLLLPEYSLRKLNSSDGHIISVNGEPSFKVVYDSLPSKSPIPAHLAWIAYIVFVAAVLVSLKRHPSLKNALASIVLLFVLAFATYMSYPVIYGELSQILSILLASLLIFVISSSLYMVRRDIWKRTSSAWSVWLTAIVALLFAGFVIWFAYISIYKVIVYTHITLSLYKIWGLTMSSLVVYGALLLMFISTALSLEMLEPLCLHLFKRRFLVFSPCGVACYSVFMGMFCVATTLTIGFQREQLVVSSWGENLSNSRDFALETHLRRIEGQIAKDDRIAHAFESEENMIAARSTLNDKYMAKFLNGYEVILQSSRDGRVAGMEDGVAIESGSRFRYAPVAEQPCRYVAAFHYYSESKGLGVIYLIIEPKYPNRRSLSALLSTGEDSQIPSRYSYAMYRDGERRYVRGNFAYPTRFTQDFRSKSSEVMDYWLKKDGFIHFITPVGDKELIVISRPYIGVGTHFICMVFLALVMYFVMLPLMRRRRKPILFEKNYFKRSMTVLVIGSILVSTAILAFVSVSFVNDRNKFLAERMMSEKVNVIRYQLQNGLRNVSSMQELASRETMDFLRRVGDYTQSDISLYRPDGKVIMSTAPQLHEKHVLGYRMDEEPYYHLMYLHEGFCIHREQLASREITMLYAPVLGPDGEVIALLSSPYVDSGSTIQIDALMHAFSVLIVFVLLLIISILAVSRVIDNTFRPLSAMSRQMREGGFKKLDSQGYRSDDEITDIINSYNRMVDDLSSSTKALAQAERDKAWSEMARNVAHEIKNPLTPMQLQIQRVQRLKAAGDPSWQEKFDAMATVLLDHIHVLTETANQFSDFAKLYSEDPVKVDLDKMLREEVALYDSREGVEFVYLGLPDVVVDAPRPQLVRVFVNLLNNAVQACEGCPGARVAVSLRNGVDPHYYEIVFEDNGEGVAEDNVDRLFTPKFTTKSSGSGLGLSICRSILERCGASISYSRSFALGGACFTILYPKGEKKMS